MEGYGPEQEGEADENVEGDVEDARRAGAQMRVGKYVCPAMYVNTFTPLEFEEVSTFAGWATFFSAEGMVQCTHTQAHGYYQQLLNLVLN